MPHRGFPWAKLAIVAALVGAVVTTTVAGLPPLKPLDQTGRVTYFVAAGDPDSTYRPADHQLAVWALEAWQRALNGALRFSAAPKDKAVVQVFWVGAQTGQYGEPRPIVVDGHTGVEHSLPVERIYKDVVELWAGSKSGYTPTLIVDVVAASQESTVTASVPQASAVQAES